MANNDVQYFLEKLYTIDKELGGKAKDGSLFYKNSKNSENF